MVITLATINGPVQVEAEVTGEWAVHRDPFDATIRPPQHTRWTITHVPTGLAIPRRLTSKVARDVVERLLQEVPTLGLPSRIATVPTVPADFGPAYFERAKRVARILAEVAP